MKKILDEALESRVKSRVDLYAVLWQLGLEYYHIAGNCLNIDKPNDIDIFPCSSHEYKRLIGSIENLSRSEEGDWLAASVVGVELKNKSGGVVFTVKHISRNAISLLHHSGMMYQVCNYPYEDCSELVDSFDYSHVQVGVTVSFQDCDDSPFPFELEPTYTDAYTKYIITNKVEYTGSQYPLGSLLRSMKYFERGNIRNRREYKRILLKCLADIVSRGYENYEDFKDQLEAVDLINCEEEIGVSHPELMDIYKNLVKKDNREIKTIEEPAEEEESGFEFDF